MDRNRDTYLFNALRAWAPEEAGTALDMLRAAGVSEALPVRVTDRLKKVAGSAGYTRHMKRQEVVLAGKLFNEGSEPVRSTLLHEVAHLLTFDEEEDHGPRWAEACYALGIAPEVEHTYRSLRVEPYGPRTARVVAECVNPHCRQEWRRKRRPREWEIGVTIGRCPECESVVEGVGY